MSKAFSSRLQKLFSMPQFMQPCKQIVHTMEPLISWGNKLFELTFEQQLTALILFHLEEHRSGQELL